MSVTPPAHRRIEQLVNRVNDALPDGYVLGYEIIHTDVPEEHQVAADREIKARWRDRLGRQAERGLRGAADDLAAMPADAVDATETQVLFEIIHPETGIAAVKTYQMSTLRDLAVEYTEATENRQGQIRQVVRNQVRQLYDVCAARVAEQS